MHTKTREQIVQKVVDGEGEWKINDLIFTIEDSDKTLWVDGDGFRAFLMRSNPDVTDWTVTSGGAGFKQINKTIGFIKKVATVLEFEINIDGVVDRVVTIDREILKPVVSEEQLKLAGKVEAYENLLIGRDLTIAGYKATQN